MLAVEPGVSLLIVTASRQPKVSLLQMPQWMFCSASGRHGVRHPLGHFAISMWCEITLFLPDCSDCAACVWVLESEADAYCYLHGTCTHAMCTRLW